jgi:hypothetical protein
MQENLSSQHRQTFSDNQWRSPDMRTASEFVNGGPNIMASSYPGGRDSRTKTCLTSSVITNHLQNITNISHNIGYTEFFSHGRDSHGQLGHAREKHMCEEACVMSPQNLSFDILIA